MKALPLNKFTAAACIWFVAAIYALLFKEGGNSAPPFPHFDKVGHFGLFFGQAWLCAKMFIQDNRTIPYKGILVAALLFAVGSELAQAFAKVRSLTALLIWQVQLRRCGLQKK